jgi:hypothetical protein
MTLSRRIVLSVIETFAIVFVVRVLWSAWTGQIDWGGVLMKSLGQTTILVAFFISVRRRWSHRTGGGK